ncbi:MAG: isochorismate synthase [Burkholderiaceae bacterium]|nr:isochorismate synthase [Burkholderiaceae bacterium]
MATTLFMSPHRSVRAHGVAARIVTPAASGHQLQHEIDQTLRRARADGILNPVVIGALPFDATQPSALIVPQQVEWFDRAARNSSGHLTAAMPAIRSAHSVPGEDRYKQGVRQAVANFGLSDIRKAVLSRVLDVELDGELDAANIFHRLAAQNPSGYQFCLPQADGSELVGVSPELLVRKEGAHLYSNPLAGSARRQPDPQQDRATGDALLASAKDTYEHRLVTDEIRRVLAPLCRELSIPAAPSLLSTSAMWHLSTPIHGVLADPAQSALQLAALLHPTPAVCGFPTRGARKLIDLVEPFERGLFAGAVGWCDADGNGEWAVTIRCGQVHGNRIRLFAGAGIVAESCPDAEWAETQAKLQTMLRALDMQEAA